MTQSAYCRILLACRSGFSAKVNNLNKTTTITVAYTYTWPVVNCK